METRCVSWKTKQKNGLMLASNGTICSKRSRLIKNEKASGLLTKLGIRTPLSIIPLIGEILL